MLLIVTNRADLATDFLILRLRQLKLPFLRFNTEDFPSRATICIDNSTKKWRWAIEIQRKLYHDFEFNGVYLRHPEIATIDYVEKAQQDFAETEVAETLRSLWRVIPDNFWLNHPRQVWIASNKIMQLMIAEELGLRVPPTIVTNSPKAIINFRECQSGGKLAAKAVRHGFVKNKDGVVLAGTQPFVLEDMEEEGTAKNIPIQIQLLITKKCDVRVVVVDNEIFPTRIFSNKTSSAPLDWRLEQLRGEHLRHETFELPPDVEALCLELPKRMGLRYSSMDLIEDQEGKFWFLELNPNGQWAWIEQLTGCKIRDAIIRAFEI